MVGCSAFGCSNRAENGFVMKVFPRDPVRRAVWAANVKRGNWYPTNRSFLCEVHFAPEMWEKTRVDGKRKLRCNAVPTIFSSTQSKPDCKPIRENELPATPFEQTVQSTYQETFLKTEEIEIKEEDFTRD